MATRCTIKIQGIDYAKVYKHWDGYPDATLEWLKDFNSKFEEDRGFNDPNYKFAQLLRSSAWDSDKYNLDQSKATGWGVLPFDAYSLEEYEYTLTPVQVLVKKINS
jgi:hypothetical protein